jgi:hypothetical protein
MAAGCPPDELVSEALAFVNRSSGFWTDKIAAMIAAADIAKIPTLMMRGVIDDLRSRGGSSSS